MLGIICKKSFFRHFFIWVIYVTGALLGEPQSLQPTMEERLQETFLSEELKSAEISFLMVEGDQELVAYHSNSPLIPASNTKLFISAAGLLYDKSEPLFPPLQTFALGSIENGVLDGDLIIDSCGSLIFSARFPKHKDLNAKNKLLSEQVERYSRQLQSAGITTINGDIRLSFERWNADPENSHYTAASAFSFNENTVDTQVKDGVLTTIPERPAMFKFESSQTVETQDSTESNRIHYNPTVDSEDFWRLSNASASDYALSMLKQYLREHGIGILEQTLSPATEKKHLFETSTGFSVGEFIHPLNQYSDNLRAELLALLLVRATSGKAEYTHLGKALRKIFADNDLQFDSLEINDGSGLSRMNRVSAVDIVTLLQFMEMHPSFQELKNSMAIAGRTGTLKNRFKGTAWEKAFYGKTGTLNGVSALSGYWFRTDKPTITVSFIGNGADNEVFWEALERFAASL